MDDATAPQFELLKLELTSIQSGIRGIDTILFQIKGWCVTVSVALASVAVSQDKAGLLGVGVGAAIVFWIVDAHYKSLQRIFIARDGLIEAALSGKDPITVLRTGSLMVPGLASAFQPYQSSSYFGMLWAESRLVLHEAVYPLTFGLYLGVATLLSTLALVMLLP